MEDALDPRLFADALNRYLSKWADSDERITMTEVPKSKRFQWLATWCQKRGRDLPSKVEFAYEVVEVLLDDPARKVVDNTKKRALKGVLDRINLKLHEFGDANLT